MKLLAMSRDEGHSAHTCHWSVPTLFMPRPYWLFAAGADWCCWNSREILVLSSTDGCASCPVWKAREGDGDGGDVVPPRGAVPLSEVGPRVLLSTAYREVPAAPRSDDRPRNS